MKKNLLLFIVLLLAFSSNAQWIEQQTPIEATLRGVHFANPDTGIAVGPQGEIIQTLDGGVNWDKIIVGTNVTLSDVRMTNDTTGFAVGNDGTILKTTDCGLSWTSLTSSATVVLRGVHFISEDIGFVSGQSEKIGITTDSGNTWNYMDYGAYWLRELDFPTPTIGYCVGDGGHIHKTIDGGVSWNSATYGPAVELWDVSFPTEDIGYVSGTAGTLIKTVDGGITWNQMNVGTSVNLYSVMFFDILEGYAVGVGGLILHTYDGGYTWITEYTGVAQNCHRIFMFDRSVGYVVGQDGLVLKKCINPVSDFSFSVDNYTVAFEDSSTYPNTWEWTFGDGDISTMQNPIHTYSDTGIYEVCLIIGNSCNSDTICHDIEITTTIGINEITEKTVNVFPNPAHEVLFVESKINIKGVEVYNNLGRKVNEIIIDTHISQIDVSSFKPGIYYLILKGDKEVFTRKVTIY